MLPDIFWLLAGIRGRSSCLNSCRGKQKWCSNLSFREGSGCRQSMSADHASILHQYLVPYPADQPPKERTGLLHGVLWFRQSRLDCAGICLPHYLWDVCHSTPATQEASCKTFFNYWCFTRPSSEPGSSLEQSSLSWPPAKGNLSVEPQLNKIYLQVQAEISSSLQHH